MLVDSVTLIATLTLGFAFLASGLNKLLDREAFVRGVLDYEILPPRLAVVYTRLLPWIELACGVALVVGVWPIGTALLGMLILASFAVAVLVNLGDVLSYALIVFHAVGSLALCALTLGRTRRRVVQEST